MYLPAITRPKEEYDILAKGGKVIGLWSSYGHDLDIFNLVTRLSAECLAYEQGFEDVPKLITVPNDHLLAGAMDIDLGGESLRQILRTTTPVEMTKYIPDLTKTQLVGLYPPHPKVAEVMGSTMWIRARQWAKYYRGPLSVRGKIVVVSFSSSLTAEQERELYEVKELVKKIFAERRSK